MSDWIAQAGGVAGALGLLALMLGTTRPLRLLGFAGWAAGMASLAWYLAPHGHRGLLAGAAVVGLLLAAVGAVILVRWPWVLPFLTLALLPARIPVSVGDTEANLLLPLYGVVAAAALALFWELPGEERRSRELGALAWPLGLWVGWTGLSILWTRDLRQAAIELLFYVLPFGLIAVSVSRLRWSASGAIRFFWLLGLEALFFAGVGVYQWVTRDVFWNPGVIVSNAYAPFYRVNSVFYDPSIYGRFLIVAILASLVAVVYGVAPRPLLGLAALIAALWVGLLVSFSQSSFGGLICGTLLAVALAWRRRALAILLLPPAVALAIGFATPHVRHTLLSKTTSSWDRATSGRASLVVNGVKIALHHPVAGVGVGGFKRAYADRLGLKGVEPKRAASHNTPVTVAAETGAPGLLLLAWLLAVAIVLPARASGPRRAGRTAAFVAAAIVAIAFHSLFYNALFEDPMFWLLGALGAVAVRARSPTATSAASATPVSG